MSNRPQGISGSPAYAMSVDEWISVLKLSTMWEFFEMRALAISQLSESIDLVTKVTLARKYNISTWLFSAYEGLAKRKESISVTEAEKLGLTTTIRIVQIREESVAKCYPRTVHISTHSYSGVPQKVTTRDSGLFDRTDCDCTSGIESAFAEELRDVQYNDIDYTRNMPRTM
jgi:hypothetical protein